MTNATRERQRSGTSSSNNSKDYKDDHDCKLDPNRLMRLAGHNSSRTTRGLSSRGDQGHAIDESLDSNIDTRLLFAEARGYVNTRHKQARGGG